MKHQAGMVKSVFTFLSPQGVSMTDPDWIQPDVEPDFSDQDDTERIEYMVKRIEAKLHDYEVYDFPMHQVRALNIFFDLSQEVRRREMFYAICMAIPRILLGLESNIYILEDEDTFVLAGCSTGRCGKTITRTWDHEFSDSPVLLANISSFPS